MSDRQPTEHLENREDNERSQQRFVNSAAKFRFDHELDEVGTASHACGGSVQQLKINTLLDRSMLGKQHDDQEERTQEVHSNLAQEEKEDDSMSSVVLVLGVQETNSPSEDREPSPPAIKGDDETSKRMALYPLCSLPSCPSADSGGSHVVSPKKTSFEATSVSSPSSPMKTSTCEGAASLLFGSISGDADKSANTVDEDDEDADSCEEDPLMIAVGLPMGFQKDSMSDEETNEGVGKVFDRREKGIEELDQEAIDEALAANVAIDDQNAKEGKKVLPEIDEAALVRRQSSRLSIHKSSSGSRSVEPGGIDSGTFRYSNSPPQQIASSPVFGTRPQGDLIMDEGDEDDEDLVVHPGLPLMPGAYSIPGVNASTRQVSEMTDVSLSEQDLLENQTRVVDSSSAEISTAGIDAELARTTPYSCVVVNGVLVDGDDEMTEEERKTALLRWRKIQVAASIGILLLAGIIAAVIVVTTRLNAEVESNGDGHGWANFGSPLNGPTGDDNIFFGATFSLSGNGLRLATGIPGIDKNVTDHDVGQVQIFDFLDGEWLLIATLAFETRSSMAGEALALSADGKRVIVGSPFWSEEMGRIAVFEDVGDGVWQRMGEEIDGRDVEGSARFGNLVSISQDGLIIAAAAPYAHSATSVKGVVRVFTYVESEWVQMGQDLVPELDDTLFGSSIALSGDGNRVVVASSNFRAEEGRVDIFDFNGTHWTQSGNPLFGSNEIESFGSSVALNADGILLAVGAMGSTGADGRFNSGKVQVFHFDAEDWIQLGGDILGSGSEAMGTSVDFSDDGILAVGCPSAREAGSLSVYYLDAKREWTLSNAIDGVTEGETFGFSVSISADGRIVGSGAPNSNFDGGRVKRVGVVRVFQNTNPEYSSAAMEGILA